MFSNRNRSGPYPGSFYLVVAANFFFFASMQWTYVTLPGYVQEIGGDAAQIGLAFGLFTLSAVAVRPVMGRLVDRRGRKPALLLGTALFALAPVLYALAPALGPFMATRLLHGVGIAAFTTAYTALVADLAPPARRGEAVGLSGITSNLAMLFAPWFGAYVQSEQGYATHFLIAAGIAALGLVMLLPVKEPRQDRIDRDESPSPWSVARQRAVWVAAFASTGLAVAYGAALGFLAPFAAAQGLRAAGGYFTAFALAMMVTQAPAGWLSDRIGRRAVAAPGIAITALAMAGLASAQTEAALLASGAGLGVSWGLMRVGLDTAVVEAVLPNARGTALSFLYACFDIGVGAGSFGLGVVAQSRGYSAAFYVAAIWAAISLAGYLVWGRGGQRDRQVARK